MCATLRKCIIITVKAGQDTDDTGDLDPLISTVDKAIQRHCPLSQYVATLSIDDRSRLSGYKIFIQINSGQKQAQGGHLVPKIRSLVGLKDLFTPP